MPALAAYEQSVSPESVAKVPLTGLSFKLRPPSGQEPSNPLLANTIVG